MGELKLCEKMMVAQAAPAAAAPAKKEKEAKKEAPKKEAKKEEVKKDDDAAAEEPKPKAKNPLDLLPKSSFDLEEWKRVYSNQDTRKEALPWLWKNVDLDGFSFWFCDYKYSDELSKVFMTCNLAGGFVARLESLRKYGFAQLIIFGDDEKGQHIGGCFLTRGKDEMPFELRDCPDWESYEWRKADAEKDRALIENYFAWDGDFSSTKAGQLAVNQGKQFK